MLNWVISILSFSLLLGGSTASTMPPCHVVTEISIEWAEDGADLQRLYTDQEIINKVLIYLRTLKPQAPSGPTELPIGPEYVIHVTLSDGGHVRYTQRGLSCFQKNDGVWQVIDPEDAIRLPLILAAIPGGD